MSRGRGETGAFSPGLRHEEEAKGESGAFSPGMCSRGRGQGHMTMQMERKETH